MVKQTKAKVSISKWVFLLNIIALGMGADGYWSASSLAITFGMAIREVHWFLGKQAFSPLMAGRCGDWEQWEAWKNISIGLPCAADRTIEKYLSFMDGLNMIVFLLALVYEKKYVPWGVRGHLQEHTLVWNT